MSIELEIEQRSGIRIVRFTRPEIRNPLSITVLEQIDAIVDGLSSDVATVIFTGAGDAFASGADLREIAEVTSDTAKEFALRGQRLMAKIDALPQMTIAGINGYCFGGALDLALACDRRIASVNATFAHPGAGLGIITGWGGTQRLPRLIGQANALEMFFAATPIDARRALSVGLIGEIAEAPVERAVKFAAKMARFGNLTM
ncbi:MAG: enoyl-CoA hydratase/isomerase family protein [Pyrinomonadaceae bacterium]